MKKLMLFIALTASVWSSFSHSQDVNKYINLRVERNGSTQSIFRVEPTSITTDSTNEIEALVYIQETVTITHKTDGTTCTFPSAIGWNIDCPGQSPGLFLKGGKSVVQEPPTETCKMNEGAFIDGYHNSESDFCANIGSTGGSNPQPLLCIAHNIAEIPSYSGNFQHTVTAEACSAPDGPVAPDDGDGEPEPPCTEDCEPTDPETPPGGDDGSDIPDSGGGPNSSTSPVTGTITDSEGNVTNINLEMQQDFTPVTARLDEANQRLKVENENSSGIIERLNALLTGTGEVSDKLDGVIDAINGIGTGEETDLSGVEGKLDGIKDSIDGIKDGFGTGLDGEAAAENVQLPEYDVASDAAMTEVWVQQDTGEAGDAARTIEGIGNELTAFDSIPQLFAFAQDNCAPLPFGRHSLDLCHYSPTISNVLTWVAYMLTLIFLVKSVHAQLQNIRMT